MGRARRVTALPRETAEADAKGTGSVVDRRGTILIEDGTPVLVILPEGTWIFPLCLLESSGY